MNIGVQHSALPVSVSTSMNFNSSGNELRNKQNTEGVLHRGRLVEFSEASQGNQIPHSTHDNNNHPHLPSNTHTRPSERLTAQEQTVGERLFKVFSDGDLKSTFTAMNLLKEELGHGPVFSLEAIDEAIDGLKQSSDSYSNQSIEPVSQSKRQNVQCVHGDTVDRFLNHVNAFQDGESRQLLQDFFSSPGLIARLASYEDYWAENLDGRDMTVNKFFDHLEDIPPVSKGTKKGISGAGGGNYSISGLGGVLVFLNRLVGVSAQEGDDNNRICSKSKDDIDPCLVGERGEKGEPGLQGEKGQRGRTGTIGAWGPKGNKGDQGPAGPRGYRHPVSAFKEEIKKAITAMNITGPQGEKGNKGSRGQRGIQGQRGHSGVKGDQGVQGLVGMTGAPGLKGEPGERALQKNAIKGSKGEKGMQGGIGAKGTAGAKGDKGISGLDGASGQAGPKGKRGLNGRKGLPGLDGSPGRKGDTGAMGARGEKGNKGETGAMGLSGSMGKNGTDGMKGDAGPPGLNGTKGEMGAPGLMGPPGLIGKPGPAWSPQNITDAQGLPDSATSCECGGLSVIDKIGVAGGVIFLLGLSTVGLYKAAKYCCGPSSVKHTADAAAGKKPPFAGAKPQALRSQQASPFKAGESIPLTQRTSAAASV
ncbi:hypothetical protein [uncultured Endozoicomonas sp.]|uniref:hypothetical protein n=1 Tax=uncultured Endozoicomonas sp. TaxID=432652 RepID=UPI002627D89E|nr:hypothetical protein [uncultured Endozoicomonas sp.]